MELEYFRVTGPRGQEVGLEGVHIQGSYSTGVLGGLRNKGIRFRAGGGMREGERGERETREAERERETEGRA